jgi:Xaa-Pro aminopeptidase
MADSIGSAGDRAAEVDRRLAAIRELIRARAASHVVLRTRRNFAWLTAGGQNHVVLATELGVAPIHVSRDEVWIEAPINEAARISDEEVAGLPIEVRTIPWHQPRAVGGPSSQADALTDADLEPELIPLRSRLSPFDHSRVRWLGGKTVTALDLALEEARAGQTEHVVAAAAVDTLGMDGIRAPVVLAAADGRIERYRHPLPGLTPIRQRLMLVLVAERWGLHAAATRIREFAPPSDALRRRIAATREVERAMHDATVPGATLGDVYEAARRAYAEAGFPNELDLHHQGGIIGYQGRERIATPGDATTIEPGMAFAWNPSITGAKAEDTFILNADGTRTVVTVSSR